MATVMHGRRKGSAKGKKELPFSTDGLTQGMHLADGTDLRQVTVLSKEDWDRIQMQLHRKQIEEERTRKIREEREEKQKKSNEMIKDWGNTIAGQRQRKLEARKLREQKEEEERQQIDLEEAKFQAQQRKEAIEKAKTQQYYQTDRVKSFHSALMLTEVLKEREAQIELKKLKQKANEGQDIEYLKRAQREYDEAIQADQHKAMERIQAAKHTAQFQMSQVGEHMKNKDKMVVEDHLEGQELKKLASQYHVEKEHLESIRKDEKAQLLKDNMAQIESIKRMKQIQIQQEEEEDEECRIFAAAKRKMMKLRAEKESEIHTEKQRHLEKIREKLGAQMKQKVSDEDDRIRRAVEEAEEKRAAEEASKEAKLRKMMTEAAEHRDGQMKEAEQKKKDERRQELETIRIRKAADEIFERNEEEKRVRKREEAMGLKDFQRVQAEERINKARDTQQQALMLDKANMELLKIEEDQFQEYAGKVIEHCERGGRNVYPLRKAAQTGAGGGSGPIFNGKGGIRPSYMVSDKSGKQMPHYQRDTTDETKTNIYGKSGSKKRLGFVW
ncbi:cilia- and flagella- associated protein 210-like [Ylistrum balloti]|uniref:cilia- and flagella- associated protein 210-like n=1 Tax=Ylistrum balloti TaxID=509963 RepID=UPI002905F78E|nr:cilia- and flagella- associated protein 210-like [Ylistrum balloti]